MECIDENQEATAHIRMSVDIYDSEKPAIHLQESVNYGNEFPEPIVERDHWKLGSSLKLMSVHKWEAGQVTNPAFCCFGLNRCCSWGNIFRMKNYHNLSR